MSHETSERVHHMKYTQITYETRGAVAVITLNRPDRLNAWTPTMSAEQAHAIGVANDDSSIGAIVMTGAGRGYCAGADMQDTFQKRISGTDPGDDTADGMGGLPRGLDWVQLIRQCKPIIAAINGPAIGVGLTMSLPMDQIIAEPQAKIGTGFIKMGLVPELASTRLLAARVGMGQASDLFLSGRVITGEQAFAIGLVDQLCEPGQILEHSLTVANSYAANPDLQLSMIKSLLTANLVETDLTEVQRRETQMLIKCWESSEHREAVAAFIEKRPAVFRP